MPNPPAKRQSKGKAKGRKQHPKVHRQRRKRNRRDHSQPTASTSDIEAQLQLQREQSATRQRTEDHEEETPKPEMGGYRYDAERNAYFPVQDCPKNGLEEEDDHDIDTTTVSTRPRQHDWLFERQACLDSRQRQRLACYGCGHVYQNRMQLTAATFPFQQSGRERILFGLLLGQGTTADYSRNDLLCKIHRPSWLRTFDVWTPPQSNNNADDGRKTKVEWQVATVVENGFVVRRKWSERQPSTPASRTFTTTTVREMFQQSDSLPQACRYLKLSGTFNILRGKMALVMLDSSETRCALHFCGLPTNDATRHLQEEGDNIYTPFCLRFSTSANDLVHDGCGTFLLATGKPNSPPGRFSFACMTDEATPLQISNLNASEILCLEKVQQGSSHQYLFGHRDGSVSLYDPRAPSIAGSFAKFQSPIASIRSVQDDSDQDQYSGNHQVLVRPQRLSSDCGSLCKLWDIRKACGGEAAVTFKIPPQAKAIQRLTQRCSGMAVDPLATTLFSPFVEDQDDGETPCLGLWSLTTGEWIGCKRLAVPCPDAIPLSSTSSVSWVELCSRRTSAWQWPRSTTTESSEDLEAEKVPGSFGLWYKVAQSPLGHKHPGLLPPPNGGNIHHIAI